MLTSCPHVTEGTLNSGLFWVSHYGTLDEAVRRNIVVYISGTPETGKALQQKQKNLCHWRGPAMSDPCFCLFVWGAEPPASHMLGKYSALSSIPSPGWWPCTELLCYACLSPCPGPGVWVPKWFSPVSCDPSLSSSQTGGKDMDISSSNHTGYLGGEMHTEAWEHKGAVANVAWLGGGEERSWLTLPATSNLMFSSLEPHSSLFTVVHDCKALGLLLVLVLCKQARSYSQFRVFAELATIYQDFQGMLLT